MCGMAVRIDEAAVRGSVAPEVFREAEALLASGEVGEVTAAGGGAAALVPGEGGTRYESWVGVVDGDFTGECDCEATDGDELCAHAVAVTLAAIREEFAWSPAAVPPSGHIDPAVRRFATVARTLPPRQLVTLVAEFAAMDHRMGARLLTLAGVWGPMTAAELTAARERLDSAAKEATAGEWDTHQVVEAGNSMISELEVLAERPASMESLLLVEHAATLWDGLARHLFEDWRRFEGVPEEMGCRIRRVHLRMCEELRLDPTDLAERLTEIAEQSEFTSCLDAPDEYEPLLG